MQLVVDLDPTASALLPGYCKQYRMNPSEFLSELIKLHYDQQHSVQPQPAVPYVAPVQNVSKFKLHHERPATVKRSPTTTKKKTKR